jgi:cell division transport system permease protein
LRIARFTVLSALRSFRSGWKLHALTAATVTTVFFVFGGGLLFFANVRAAFLGSGGETEMTVYLREAAELESAAEIRSRFCRESFVRRCRFISTSDARREFIAAHPDLSSSVSTLAENPFPASVRIEIDPAFRDERRLRDFSGRLGALPGVEGIGEGGEWLLRWVRVLDLVDTLFLAVMTALGLAVLFVVSNTIRILLHAKRDEIEILSLVGATDRMIRAPFLLEGAIQGGIGALTALAILAVLFDQGRRFAEVHFAGLLPSDLVFLPLETQFVLLVVGLSLGLIGSALAVGRFLRS